MFDLNDERKSLENNRNNKNIELNMLTGNESVTPSSQETSGLMGNNNDINSGIEFEVISTDDEQNIFETDKTSNVIELSNVNGIKYYYKSIFNDNNQYLYVVYLILSFIFISIFVMLDIIILKKYDNIIKDIEITLNLVVHNQQNCYDSINSLYIAILGNNNGWINDILFTLNLFVSILLCIIIFGQINKFNKYIYCCLITCTLILYIFYIIYSINEYNEFNDINNNTSMYITNECHHNYGDYSFKTNQYINKLPNMLNNFTNILFARIIVSTIFITCIISGKIVNTLCFIYKKSG